MNGSAPNPIPPPVQPKSSSRVLRVALAALAGIIILAAGGTVGFWYGKSQIQPCPEQQCGTIPVAPPTQTLTPADEMAGWKTYRHSSGKYEFKYPAIVEVQEIGDPKKDDCVKIQQKFAFLVIKMPLGSTGGCVQTGVGAFDTLTPVEEDVELGGDTFKAGGNRVDSSRDIDAKTKLSEFLRILAPPVKDFVVEYGGYYNPGDFTVYNSEKDGVRQILSTFKFTE